MSARRTIVLTLLALAGCGKSSGGGNDLAMSAPDLAMPDMTPANAVTGTLGGQPVPVAAAIFYTFFGGGLYAIQLSSDANVCSDVQNGFLRRGAVDVYFQRNDPFAVGHYNVVMHVPGAGEAIAYTRVLDASCAATNGNGVSGSLDISAATSDGVSGTFDVMYTPGGDHLTGRFSAVACAMNGNPTISCP